MIVRDDWSTLKKLIYLRGSGAAGGAGSWDTITGNPVSFTAKAAPLRQLKVAFYPVQSLNGYDAPWPAGGGANKWDEVTEIGGINITTGEDSSESYQIRTKYVPVVGGESYKMVTTDTPDGVWMLFYDSNKGVIAEGLPSLPSAKNARKCSNGSTVTMPSNCAFVRWYFQRAYGTTYNHDTALNYPSSVTTYSPYSNECPISGWDSLTAEQRGKNLYPASSIQSYAYSWYSHPNFADAVQPIFLKAGTTYVVSGERDPQYSTWFFLVRMFDTQGNNVDDVTKISGGIGTFTYNYVAGGKYFQPSGSGSQILYQTITPAIDCYVDLCVQASRGEATNAMVEIGSTPSATYVPYNPSSRSISITIGSTVYSGWVDVISGVGEVTMAKIVLDGTQAELAGVNWRPSANSVAFYYNYPSLNIEIPANIVTKTKAISETQASESYNNLYANDIDCFAVTLSGGNARICVRVTDTSLTTKEATNAYLALHPITIVYPLATPIPIQLTPQEVQSLLGENVLFSDANGDLTVEYRSN